MFNVLRDPTIDVIRLEYLFIFNEVLDLHLTQQGMERYYIH